MPPTPFSALLRTPSESPARNVQSQSEPTKLDNRTTFENALMAIPTHAGMETQDTASRSVWRYASNSRCDLTQNTAIGRYPFAAQYARTSACAGLYPAGCNISPAHNSLSSENSRRIAAPAQDNAARPLCSACRGSKWVSVSLCRRPARLRPMVGQVVWCPAAASGSGHCPPGR